jgi:hypothetical protein
LRQPQQGYATASQQILAATALENARKQGDSATPGYQ